MVRDLNDHWSWIQRLVSRVSRLESGSMLENSSITNGRMRFIGGTLRVDSGGRAEIVGTLQVDGETNVTGKFTLSGQDWAITGDGTISGDVIVSGTLNVTGNSAFGGTLAILGVTTLSSDLNVTGGGRVNVGSNMTLTPATDGGAVVFSGGSKLSANASSIGLTYGTSSIRTGADLAGLLAGGNSLNVSSSGVQINTGAIPAESTSGLPSGTLSITSGGFLRRAA